MSSTKSTPVFTASDTTNGVRSGALWTRAGVVRTPTFMPDGTRGAVKGLTPDQVSETGVEVVLANTYHLHMMPGEEVIANLGGLHDFTRRQGPMLTDSGGFQVFSLAHINKITEDGVTFKDPRTGDTVFLSPEKSIQIQMKLGADMMVAFDDVTSLDEKGRARTLEAFERTHRWLERSLAEFQRLTKDMATPEKLSLIHRSSRAGSPAATVNRRERPLLFGVVQGGLDKDLRKRSLEIVQSLPVDGIAIGGLSVGETREEMHNMLEFLAPLYDPSRPRFLLGVGDPIDLRYAIEHGIDMLDCVLPTRNARHATAWIHNPCTCDDKGGQATPGAASRSISDLDSLRGSVAVPSVRRLGTPQNKLATRLECKTCGPRDMKIHLTNEKFKEDTEVIDPGCDCTTCRIPHPNCHNGSERRSVAPKNSAATQLVPTGTTGRSLKLSGTTASHSSGHCPSCGEAFAGYSRGFLRHQFKVGETLAGSLVSIHNIRYLQRICELYRSER